MARFIHAILRRHNAGRRVLDVGCGLGREVAYLCEQGYDAMGLDNSPKMIAWAREHHPNSHFFLGNQDDFALDQQFDTITCMGSTLLYNYTTAALTATLRCFHRHVAPGGLLLMDMRNAAFFLTTEGQQWLRKEHHQDVNLPEGVVRCLTRFELDVGTQLLERFYTWTFSNGTRLQEQLRHRLIFPQEMRLLLESCGFAVIAIFDEPAAHIGEFSGDDFSLGHSMRGRRMQVLARAIDGSAPTPLSQTD